MRGWLLWENNCWPIVRETLDTLGTQKGLHTWVGPLVILQVILGASYFYTFDMQMISLCCGFSHVSSNVLVLRSSCHPPCTKTVSVLSESFCEPSGDVIMRSYFYTLLIFSWLLKSSGLDMLLSHSEHLNSFCLEWVLSWSFRWCDREELFLHFWHMNDSLSVMKCAFIGLILTQQTNCFSPGQDGNSMYRRRNK